MTSTQTRAVLLARTAMVLAAGGILVGSLAGCAPETSSGTGADGSSSAEGAQADADASGADKGGDSAAWEETGIPGGGDGKSVDVPDSFPSEKFVVPDGAVVDDVGSRTETSWFIVLRADDRSSADKLWESVITKSDFSESDREDSGESGVSAQLNGSGLSVSALLIPEADGSVLLSYDLVASP